MCYRKQQSQSSESVRQLTLSATYRLTLVNALDGVTLFWPLKDVKIHVNVCETVKLLAGFLQYNGTKLKEAEDFKCIFFVYCLFESKEISSGA